MKSNSDPRKIVAVLFGGRSLEHEISVITAIQMIEAMDTVKYSPLPVYITTSGKWYTGEALLKRDFYKNMPASLSQVKEVVLLPVPGIGGLTVMQPKTGLFGGSKEKEIIPVDIFFPAFHGAYGEDGCVQGLLEMADVTYTGCNVLSSAMSMSKYHCKKFLESHQIPVLPSLVVHKEELDLQSGGNLAKIRQKILSTAKLNKFPLFVKPANLGSSIGIAKATNEASLDSALLQSFKYDREVIVEPCLDNKLEINVSVLDGKQPIVSVVEIPVPAAGQELTYEDKYLRDGGKKTGHLAQGMAGLARVIDPDNLDQSIKTLAQEYALKAFLLLGCAGVVRIDFLLDLNDGTLYFNENNPLPGSLAYYLWINSKPPVLYTELINRIIERAETRKQEKAGLIKEIGFKALLKG